ncbi:transposase [Bradyrhizobium sp. Ash2021]|uniref:IS66 family transposase n=1 Tax=Bradyrhizobium sp. Ash2021 TaxID=2954771 RepID=UPI0035BEE3F5
MDAHCMADRAAPYAPDRKVERPIAHLAGLRGVLQVDDYAGYKVLAVARCGSPSARLLPGAKLMFSSLWSIA